MAGRAPSATSLAGADDTQPQLTDDNVPLRRLRTRPQPRAPTLSGRLESASPSRHRREIKSDQAGSTTRASSSRPSGMPHSPAAAHRSSSTTRLTKTGRISRAKRGLKDAHPCEQCGKSYSRNEHLKRHQRNHEPAKLQCSHPGCGRAFCRDDLLERHELKHIEPGRQHSLSVSSTSFSPTGSSDRKASGPASRADKARPEPPDPVDLPFAHYAKQPSPPEKAVTPPFSVEPIFDTNKPIPPSQTSSQIFNVDPVTDINDPPFSANADGIGFIFPNPVSYDHYATPNYTTFGFGDLNVDPPWSFFPSTSISPLSTTPQLSYLEPDNIQLPFSVPPSPKPQQAAIPGSKMVPQVSGSVPYPLPWSGHRDEYGSLSLDGALEEQHLGRYLSLDKKQHFVEAYWAHFHPLFPILHRQTYQRHRANALFSAAVMAVGAQFSDRGFAKSDSRILHEKCLELMSKCKGELITTTGLEYMQAVFLIELLSHFTAKRAPTAMSEIFMAMYNQLWSRHNNMHFTSIGKTELDCLSTIQPNTPERELGIQWRKWIHEHSFERLLVASYILESRQALLLVRPNSSPRAPEPGLDLYMPFSTSLWDINSAAIWAQYVRTRGPIETAAVFHTLEDIQHSPQDVRFDDFQSSLLTACHTNSVLSQSLDASPYLTQSHPTFVPENHYALEQVLSRSHHIQLQHQMTLLASVGTPLKALLAVSGESWVLSQKLSSVAREAKDKYEALQAELRLWCNDLQPAYSAIVTGPGHATPTLFRPSSSRAAQALRRALRILLTALDASPSLPAFGPELALYYAALVIWAATHAAVLRAEADGLRFDAAEPPAAAAAAAASAPPDADPRRDEPLVRAFAVQALADVDAAPPSACVPPADATARWKAGAAAALRWAAWLLGGAAAPPAAQHGACGAGELVDSAQGVLEKLAGRRGWAKRDWF